MDISIAREERERASIADAANVRAESNGRRKIIERETAPKGDGRKRERKRPRDDDPVEPMTPRQRFDSLLFSRTVENDRRDR